MGTVSSTAKRTVSIRDWAKAAVRAIVKAAQAQA